MKGSVSVAQINSLTKEEMKETPMINMMYDYLYNEKQPVNFYTLMDTIAQYKEWTAKEKQKKLVQAYTDMNIDGRFVALGDNQWGLKSWYPVGKTEEQLATMIAPQTKKKVKEDGFDDYNEAELEEYNEAAEEIPDDAVADKEYLAEEFADDDVDGEIDSDLDDDVDGEVDDEVKADFDPSEEEEDEME